MRRKEGKPCAGIVSQDAGRLGRWCQGSEETAEKPGVKDWCGLPHLGENQAGPREDAGR